MNKHPHTDEYDRYYVDPETGERAYASDGSWAPIMVRVLLLIFVAVTAVMAF